MLRAQGSVVIAASAQEVLEFVLDLERYRGADPKIGTVKRRPVLDADGRATVRYRGVLRGITTPVDTQEVELDRWSTLTIRGAPGVWTRWTTDFEGTFECTGVEGGATLVRHTETFWFRPAPLRWAAEAYLGRWMAAEMVTEMARIKELVEAGRGVRSPR